MIRILVCVLTCALLMPAVAEGRSLRFCVPTFIEGAGTVLICPPARRR